MAIESSAPAVGARRQRLGRLALAGDARHGRARAVDRGRRRRRRHVQPDHLREGPLDGRLVRRAASDDPRATRRSEGDLPRAGRRGRTACVRSPRAVWERTGGVDGYVSLEVDPALAYDRDATFAEAMRLHDLGDRPNLYVKIPGTAPGIGAIEDCIAAGRRINVTLIFSLERHAEVAEAYIRGVERLLAAGGDPADVASVASFFVSRVDTEADRRLAEVGRPDLQGRLAIANAKLAYQHYLEDVCGRALGRPGRRRSDAAALPVGLDLDEEPGLPRRALRRGAHRPGHREHDAVRDDRVVPGSRGHRGDPRRGCGRGAELFSRSSRTRESTTTTSWRPSRPKASRSSPTRSRPSSTASSRNEPRSWPDTGLRFTYVICI